MEFYRALASDVETRLRQDLTADPVIRVGREINLRLGSYELRARIVYVDPPLASVFTTETSIVAQARPPEPGETDINSFLAEVIRYPDPRYGSAFDSLVGLDHIKVDLFRKLVLQLSPRYLDRWADKCLDAGPSPLRDVLHRRYPLFLLEGEVGAGKTALSRSIGHPLSQRLGTDVLLYIVNAQVRGSGHVGELTQNISRAFEEAERAQESEQVPVMILVDEADALAQQRGSAQTHHEDDAGVNTLIQRIDRLRGKPMAVLFATNLVTSLDSAILRRAFATYHSIARMATFGRRSSSRYWREAGSQSLMLTDWSCCRSLSLFPDTAT